MISPRLLRRPLAAAVLAVMTAGCSTATVYPGAKLESKSPQAYATSDSFATVYGWYKRHLPPGSELSHAKAPSESAVFFTGHGNRGRRVTIAPATRCCATMIIIGDVNS